MANVLIIDDEKTICDLLSHMVKHMGHEVTYALSLEEGLKEVSSKTFDVVFLDIQLRGGSGFDLVPFIQSSAAIIFITAYDEFYKKLVAKIDITDVSSAFAMERIKETSAFPLNYIEIDGQSKSKKS